MSSLEMGALKFTFRILVCVTVHHSLLHTLSLSHSVVEIGFFAMEEDGSEQDEEISVTITRSAATAIPVTISLTPVEYDSSFGFDIPTFDPDSPNIATGQ